MRKKFIGVLFVFFSFIFSFNFFSSNFVYAENGNDKIYLGGGAVGFSISMQGAYIVGLCDVITENGIKSPAKDIGIEVGDVLLSIDGTNVNSAKDIEKALKDEKEKVLCIKRLGEKIFQTITPAKDVFNKYKLGIFVKDDMNGIGTITFIQGKRFASLGHPILDENEKILDISGGCIYNCKITGCIKGERGMAGELRGVIDKSEKIGKIEKNITCGVYGDITERFDTKSMVEIETGEAKVGNANIYSTISGEKPKMFSISIVKIENDQDNKNFVIKINDKELISKTGGIIQGLSGSPIVQDGKLVGAVTHVFINDPTRGFGISIKNMLNK